MKDKRKSMLEVRAMRDFKTKKHAEGVRDERRQKKEHPGI